jgi:hypothetical protein
VVERMTARGELPASVSLVHHAAAAGKRVAAVESARTRERVDVTAPGREAAFG